MNINERFETIINVLYNGNKRAFAYSVGISPTVVENVVGKRKGKPSYDVLSKICANANVSAKWLLTGHGQPFPTDVNGVKQTQINHGGSNKQFNGTVEMIEFMEGETIDENHEDQTIIKDYQKELRHLQTLIENKDELIASLKDRIADLLERIDELKENRPLDKKQN